MILREVEGRTGKPGGFIESDLVDPRYFSAANIKNRLKIFETSCTTQAGIPEWCGWLEERSRRTP